MVIRYLLQLVAFLSLSFISHASATDVIKIDRFNQQAVNIEELKISVSTDQPSVWSRQQFRIWLEVETADKFASLQAEEWLMPGFTVIPVPASRLPSSVNDGKVILKTGWLLYASSAGEHTIAPPAVDYVLGGSIKKTFRLPAMQLSVRALPPYIPPTMPVGEISLHAAFTPSMFFTTGQLSRLSLTMSSTEVMPASFPPVLRQLKSADDIQFLPADSQRQVNPGVNGINATVLHDIAFKARSNGVISFPPVRAQYFDPHTGRVETVRIEERSGLSLHRVFWYVLLAFVGYLLWKFADLARAYIINKRASWRELKNAIRFVQTADNYQSLQQALRRYAKAKRWRHNGPMLGWVDDWQTMDDSKKSFRDAVHALSQGCYAKHVDVDYQVTRKTLLQCLGISWAG